MKTSQPSWKILFSTDYSRVLIDETGAYSPELELTAEIHDSSEKTQCVECYGTGKSQEIQSIDDSAAPDDCNECWGEGTVETGNKFIVHRIVLDKLQKACRGDRTFLVSDRWNESWDKTAPVHQYNEWFVESLPDVARYVGLSVNDLWEGFTSDSIGERAQAYEDVASYHGADNFDCDPLTLTETELNERWEK